MKKIFFIPILIFSVSCASQLKIKDFDPNLYSENFKEPDSIFIVKPKRVETAYKGFKYPYIHINGYKGYSITASETLNDDNFKNLNELKLYHTYSSFYTRKMMYENFGNWNKYFFIKGERAPFLIWENVQLFKEDKKLYTVIAGGYECTTCKGDTNRIYSSIFLLDENDNDFLTNQKSDSTLKVIDLFSKGIRNLSNSNEFYRKFWGLALKKKIKQ